MATAPRASNARGGHVGDGAAVLTELGANARPGEVAHSVMVRVRDLNSHHDRAKKHGAKILHSPNNYPYGERQYTVEDLGGHRWTFTQSTTDVDPKEWGGTPGQL